MMTSGRTVLLNHQSVCDVFFVTSTTGMEVRNKRLTIPIDDSQRNLIEESIKAKQNKQTKKKKSRQKTRALLARILFIVTRGILFKDTQKFANFAK